MASLILVENYGRMLDSCKLGNGSPRSEVAEQWQGIIAHEGQLRLYQSGEAWALSGHDEVQLPCSAPPCELRFSFMSPAKGDGFAELALLDERTGEWREVVLTASYESWSWVRSVGESLALYWSASFTEADLGQDY